MNSLDPRLERLLNSAAQAPRNSPQGPPPEIALRVLAHWRGLGGAGDIPQFLLPLLRRAALCACLLMIASVVCSYRAFHIGDNDAVILANSAVDLTLLP